jgi:hypothetical protein
MKSTNVNSLVLAAAFAGLLGGTSARLNAQPVSGQSATAASSPAFAGVMVAANQKDLPKHACKARTTARARAAAIRSMPARTPARVRAPAPPTVPSPPRPNLYPV